MPGGSADAVVMCGVLSLIAEPDELLDEAIRLLTPEGHLGIADLYAAGDSDLKSEPNVFRTPQTVIDLCARGDWSWSRLVAVIQRRIPPGPASQRRSTNGSSEIATTATATRPGNATAGTWRCTSTVAT